MIALAPLLALLALAPGDVFESPESGAKEISIQLLATTKGLSDVELSTLRIVAKGMTRQTTDYVRRDMMAITGGRPIRTTMMPDHVRVSLTVGPDGLAAGIGLMDSLARRATLTADQIREVTAKDEPSLPWQRALMPDLPVASPSRNDVLSVYRRVFSADNVFLAVGGNFSSNSAKEQWASRVARWEAPPKVDKYRTIPSRPTGLASGPPVLILEGKPFASGAVDFATRYLALVALGTGKGSSLHRLWRDQEAWSYRQEAVLWPVPEGWQPRLIAVMDGDYDRKERAAVATQVLLQDVEKWSDLDRRRAIGMLEGGLLFDAPFSPLYLAPNGAPDDDLAGRTFLAGYWPMKTGRPWSPTWLLQSARSVRLDEMKEAARAIVAESRPRWSPEG